MKKEHLHFFSLYKFIASIILACFLHYTVFCLNTFGANMSGMMPFLDFLLSGYSNLYVEMFFIISGMLFQFAYETKIISGEYGFISFMLRRSGKLLPFTTFTTLVMFVLRLIWQNISDGRFFWPGNMRIRDLFYSLIFVNATITYRVNPPAWYVADLLVCYMLAYGLAKGKRYLGRFIYLIPILLGIIIQLRGMDYPFFNLSVSRAYNSFFIGVILAGIIGPLSRWIKVNKKRKLIVYAAGLCTLFMVYILRFRISPDGSYDVQWCSVATFVIFPNLILMGYFSDIVNAISDNRVVRFLGDISFDIYLWNCAVLIVLDMVVLKTGLPLDHYYMLVIVVIIHIMVGIISYLTRKKIKSIGKKNEIKSNSIGHTGRL